MTASFETAVNELNAAISSLDPVLDSEQINGVLSQIESTVVDFFAHNQYTTSKPHNQDVWVTDTALPSGDYGAISHCL